MSSPSPDPSAPRSLYDVMAYPKQVHVQTHPERLATIGRLYGLECAPPTRCRVLEIGCGDAGNLIPMAWSLPESSFTGLDLAATPIAEGQALVDHLGLTNIRLVQADLMTVDASWGEFDYIVAHGIFAWVPDPVRQHLLEVCRQCLAPAGIAFISYNTMPGAHMSLMMREMMLFHAGRIPDPNLRVQQALGLAQLIARATPTNSDPGLEWLRAEARRVTKNAPAQVFHDEMAPTYAPVYFSEFMQHAARHDLAFVGEVDMPEMSDHLFTPEARGALAQLAEDRLRQEQYRDFLKMRRFRQTLLTHRRTPVRAQPDPSTVSTMIATLHATLTASSVDLAPGEIAVFTGAPAIRIETDFPPGKAALLALVARHPTPCAMPDLTREVVERLGAAGLTVPPIEVVSAALNGFMLQLFEHGLVKLHTWQPSIVRTPGERPAASPIARWQCARDARLTTLSHQSVEVQDVVGKLLIKLLDGTRDRSVLVDAIQAELAQIGAIDAGGETPATVKRRIAGELDKNLQQLADIGLLLA